MSRLPPPLPPKSGPPRRKLPDAGSMLPALSSVSQEAKEALSDALLQSETTKLSDRRLAATKLLENANLKYCDFDFVHHLTPLIGKTSASATSLIFGDVPVGHTNEIAVAIKAGFKMSGDGLKSDNSAPIERVNYKIIANTIITENWSPHVLAYVGSFECDKRSAFKVLGDALSKNITRDLTRAYGTKMVEIEDVEKIIDRLEMEYELSGDKRVFQQLRGYKKIRNMMQSEIDGTDTETLSFLITEKAVNSKPLKVWLGEPHTFAEMKAVLFQILYTLECFNRIGFRHNDAHWSNILVEDRSNDDRMSETSVYDIDDNDYCVPTKKNFVKIFDFDRSSFNCDLSEINKKYRWLVEKYEAELLKQNLSDDTCENTFLKALCDNYGQCNGINKKYDAYLTLGFIREKLRNLLLEKEKMSQEFANDVSRLLAWINKQVEGADIRSIKQKHLPGGFVPTDEQMVSVEAMLDDEFFIDFMCLYANPDDVPKDQHYTMPLDKK